jgi:hypothetical protein
VDIRKLEEFAPFGVSANSQARLAVANGLMFASQRLFELR